MNLSKGGTLFPQKFWKRQETVKWSLGFDAFLLITQIWSRTKWEMNLRVSRVLELNYVRQSKLGMRYCGCTTCVSIYIAYDVRCSVRCEVYVLGERTRSTHSLKTDNVHFRCDRFMYKSGWRIGYEWHICMEIFVCRVDSLAARLVTRWYRGIRYADLWMSY